MAKSKFSPPLEEVLNLLDEAVIGLGPHGAIVAWNQAAEQFYGLSLTEAMGKPLADTLAVEDCLLTTAQVLQEAERSNRWRGEAVHRVADGRRAWVEWVVKRVQRPEEKAVHFLSFARNISEWKIAEERARQHQQQIIQADKMLALGTLVSGVAHEINNPNNFIMLNTPILQEAWESMRPILDRHAEEEGDFLVGGLDYSEMRDTIPLLFSGVVEGAKRIKRIVGDLKNFARTDASGMDHEVDVNAGVQSALTLVSNLVKKASRNFKVEFADDLPPVRGNTQRLQQVIINLLQNACQALERQDQAIEIRTAFDAKAGEVKIIVRDEGVGIPPEAMPHLFDPFYTTRRERGGTGLGLSVASSIVQEHGGRLEFQSTPKRGTTVTLSLPAKPPAGRG